MNAPSFDPALQTAGFDPARLSWLNRYAALGERFGTPQAALGLPGARWVARSDGLAASLGWPADWSEHPDTLAVLSGTGRWPGMAPMATVYGGHQFGVWAGQLGDGRALLLGEIDSAAGPQELQLKGSGPTPYSRRGDGRAVLRSSVREFLCSEAMHGLGIPTTRALALTASDLPVMRERMETAAVVTRMAPSFLRFGHFEHFCHHGQHEALRTLADFVLQHHYPQCLDAPVPVAAMLAEVSRRTADLLADWQAVGFCHGVMNTDNMSMLGLTIDYGPFGFLDGFDPGHICNHSDDRGRYAYARQPQVAYWNLHALAQALLPLVGDGGETLAEAVGHYRDRFPVALAARMADKFGLQDHRDEDGELINDALRLLAGERVDYTLFFRRLSDFGASATADAALADLFVDRDAWQAWAQRYRDRLALDAGDAAARRARLLAVNPKYVLRNHLAEQAIRQAQAGDFSEVQRLHRLLQHPFDEQPEHEADAGLPPDWASGLEISCSS
ncbi:uncharacterized protein YdiU (UPF0061 family) [Sphaerotilus hippei]|uniref:Protein nucleotidyltransferase YdiU n=1 Tax=Sphaerotilus hippei TaxID=744406 RepID=A0A318H3H1_9BURK|nr:YdiU family protein [Sphaerotilus hippei]PXW97990.1 uncharacterized protein YdiU (UPF0061 family) [Sphaerotilus hippei]